MTDDLPSLLTQIDQCQECAADLPHEPRPVLVASKQARILIIGQAPGARVHESGIAWDDPSGQRLRDWMGISSEDFYNASKVALVPMGFCFPGSGSSGDLPPRPECSRLWHGRLLPQLTSVKLTLLIGRYAQSYMLGEDNGQSVTHTVKAWRQHTPRHLPLPHPSPRNNRWLKTNPWFLEEVVPYLRRRVKKLVNQK